MHAEHDVLHDGLTRERNPLLGQASKDDARIRRSVDGLELEDARGQLHAPAHGCVEERLLRVEMPQHGSGRDAEVAGDVGERRRREAFLREDGARGLKDLLAADGRWASHL